MRKITLEATKSFVNWENYSSWNTKVKYIDWISYMYLHWNLIATKNQNNIWISSAGWETNTTKERLNGILNYTTSFFIQQTKWILYIMDAHSDIKVEFDIGNELENIIIF